MGFIVPIWFFQVIATLIGLGVIALRWSYRSSESNKAAREANERAKEAERVMYREGSHATRIRVAIEQELDRLGGGHYSILDPRPLEGILLCRPCLLPILFHTKTGGVRGFVQIHRETGEVKGFTYKKDPYCQPCYDIVDPVVRTETSPPIVLEMPEAPGILPRRQTEDLKEEVIHRVKDALARGRKSVSYRTDGLSSEDTSSLIDSARDFGRVYLSKDRIRVFFREEKEAA